MDIYSVLVLAACNPYCSCDDGEQLFRHWRTDGRYLGMFRLRLLEMAWKIACAEANGAISK